MRIEEKMLILPALYIIDRNEGATTSTLIEELTAVFKPNGEDAKILAGRNDTKFSQKVRNLKSHRDNNDMWRYTDISSNGKYTLTEDGKTYLEENRTAMEYLFSNPFDHEDSSQFINAVHRVQGKKTKLVVYNEEDMVSEGKASKKESMTKSRSKRLRAAAITHYKKENGKLYCSACSFCFEDTYGELGKDFIEIHHEKPLYQYSGDDFEKYIGEAIKNVKPLCSNCHRMIHRNVNNPLTIEELQKRIKV